MHAARAIHKQREKREEKPKLDVRRPSAASYTSRLPRSPAVSVDASARKSQSHIDEPTDHLNLSYVGFIIAVFGAVPLIVGTFVEVPALWEVGLGVTLVGLFMGILFWCTELLSQAKKFSQKKNQLSSRGKIEDSNLLQVPDRKFGNGMDSRRDSFQSDSVSLISPAVQHYAPKNHPNLAHLSNAPDRRTSMSQYSSDFSTSSGRVNGHLIPPALLLRGNGRRDDGRVVSLVQPDPGLDDDSDSDAETVIEAPLSHSHSNTKIIQVQSCQEKQQHLNRPLLGTTFNLENERISPLAPHHRTIRMPVMPQEVDKLQRCECGRYLLTERDKLIGIRLPGIGGSNSSSTTTSNSSTPLSSLPVPAIPSSRKALRGNFGLNLEEFADGGGDNNGTGAADAATPLADQPPPPPPHKIINVNPSVKIAPIIPPTPQNIGNITSNNNSCVVVADADSVVQVDPTTTDFLSVASARTKTETFDDDFDDEEEDGGVTPGNEFNKTFQEAAAAVEDGKDQILTELLELTDINDEEVIKENERMAELQASVHGEPIVPGPPNDENHNTPEQIEQQDKQQLLSREGSRRRFEYQSQVTSINRPTSLPLPVTIYDLATPEVAHTSNIGKFTRQSAVPAQVMEMADQPTITAEKESDESQQGQPSRIQSGKRGEEQKDEEGMSLDDLLDSIEKNQEGEVLAVVVQ